MPEESARPTPSDDDRARQGLRGASPDHRSRADIVLVLVLSLVGLGLRLAGLSYGLPDHIFHEDTLKQILRVPHFLRGEWTGQDTYPTLHMHIVAGLLKAAELLDPRALGPGPSLTLVAVTARLLNAVLGAGTVCLVYLLGRRLLGRGAGLVAAALTAVSSLLVLHAHYEMGDTAQAFFVTASVAAAARVLVGGRGAAFVVAGVCAGLAASAKYYGGIVLGALVVAALPGIRAEWRRRLAWLGLATVAAAAAFVLTTPKLLLTPLDFVATLGDAFETLPPPPLVRRPIVAAQALIGIGLEWFGPWLLTLAALGIPLLARRGSRGWLVLAMPALVLGLYAGGRAHRLDDRNLVILAPFLFLAVAAGLVWLAQRARWARLVATAIGIALLGSATLDGLHVAYLFWQEDTRQFALRWVQRHVSASAKILTITYHDSIESYQAHHADLLELDSKEWVPYTVWYAWRRRDEPRRAAEFLSTRGKLLMRFELLHRAFTSPTLAYYDVSDAMAVPHAFPPPEDAASAPDTLVFLDDDALPDRLGVFVPRHQSATHTLVSRKPLSEVSVALSGVGRVRVRQGGTSVRVDLTPGEVRLVRLAPRRAFPWFKYFYPLTIEAGDGHVYARILTTPCEVAWLHLFEEQWARAIPQLDACRGSRWGEPSSLLDLAWAHAQLGHPAEARRALEALRHAHPGLLETLVDLARQDDGEAWRERYRRVAGHPPWFWRHHSFVFQAEDAPLQIGTVVELEASEGGQAVLLRPGTSQPEFLKIWFPQPFLRGHYLVRFRLRGVAAGSGPLATLSVVRHFQDRVYDIPVSRPWSGTKAGGDFVEVALPVRTELEPIKLEARVFYHGTGWLEIDQVAIVPDLRAALSAKLAALGDLLASRQDRDRMAPAPAAGPAS